MSATDPGLQRTALYLSLVQFLFFTTWVVYVTYLGDLLERIGIGRQWLIWFIFFDQLVFALSDTAMGYAADRFERVIGRLGPLIIGVNGLSCLAFGLLPLTLELEPGTLTQTLFVVLILIWIATSSVLRAPPLVLLMKHAARPQAPRLAALSLVGLALGGALSPYLGLWMKSIDPLFPFLVTGATLFLVTLGLARMERLLRARPEPVSAADDSAPRFRPFELGLFLAAALLLGFGFQIQAFLMTKPQYLRFVEAANLIWVLPVFWVGFKLLVFPGSAAARRFGPSETMALAAFIGALAVLGSLSANSLPAMIAAQLVAGGAWGVLFMAGISAALGIGTRGREGLALGLWFSMLSAAAVIRVGLVLSGIKQAPTVLSQFAWAPPVLWALGGILLLFLATRSRNLKSLFRGD